MFSFIRRLFQRQIVRRPRNHGNMLRLETLEDRVVPTLLGQSLFPADNAWNQQITNAPVAANSTAIVNNIVTKYGNGRLHPDFGQDTQTPNADLYGIPYNIVHGNSTPKVHVVVDAYADESDLQNAPIAGGVVLEGDFQNGPNVGVDNRGDSHLIVWDQDNNIDYEFYRASRPSENADGLWHADQETVWDMKKNTFRTIGFTSADAAGLAILPGLVRPDEGLPVAEGGQGAINHAIRFTLQNSIILDQFIYPASHIANSGTNAGVQPPMGARFRLKAGVDISTLNPESRVIAQAMKDYGMIVADNGSNFFFSGASYSVDGNNHTALTWNDDDVQDTTHGLKSLHFGDFEVVDLTPVVSSLSVSSGAAGTAVTILGQNFSGAAGHLQVLFGNTAASSVTVVNDTHVLAVAPSGTGTVDVRVQSGITTPANSENIKSTIFGYGISAVSANDRFTYGTSTNQAPLVASPAKAMPSVVTGKTTVLSVLGADDGGEANLQYHWTSSGPAVVVFSANGTNAAKNTVATFKRVGNYLFTVTITDAAGLFVTSSVTVKVTQKLTTLSVKPDKTTVPAGGQVQLTATEFDQFGVLMTTALPIKWTANGGSVNSHGSFTAPRTSGGSFTVTAKADGVKGTVTILVGPRGRTATPSWFESWFSI